jgi:hypothetical protein
MSIPPTITAMTAKQAPDRDRRDRDRRDRDRRDRDRRDPERGDGGPQGTGSVMAEAAHDAFGLIVNPNAAKISPIAAIERATR